VQLGDKSFDAKVYMNHVLDVKGYRFFQASYDEDEKGTVLSVNKDVVGRRVTYFGYLLLLIGFVLVFTTKNSRFRQLAGQLNEVRSTIAKIIPIILLIAIPTFSSAQEKTIANAVQEAAIDRNHAAKFGVLPVQSNGRIEPVNTFSSEILRKIYKQESIGDFNSDQFLLSFLAFPEIWTQTPIIAIPSQEISAKLQLPEDYASYNLFFDRQGNYRLLMSLHRAYMKSPSERDSFDKDMMKLDERVNIIDRLLHHGMLAIYPDPQDSRGRWVAPGDSLSTFSEVDSLFVKQSFVRYLADVRQASQNGNWNKPDASLQSIKNYQIRNDRHSLIHPQKLHAEIRYNEWKIFDRCKIGYFLMGGLLLIFSFIQMLKNRPRPASLSKVVKIVIVAIFLFHGYGIALRWYVSGYAPWSNSYETMVYVAAVTVLAGMIFGRKSTITLAMATVFGGIILFVSGLNWMDPQIGNLVPVLKSPWLMFHVAVIVAAYGFLGVGFMIGIVNLLLMTFTKRNRLLAYRIKELTLINQITLMVGLALLTIGTFLGAVWANESWGRYWGWDPKETWALITIVVYTVVTHIHLMKKWDSDWLMNLLSVLAFSSVLMTFFGVNYFLSGMHSYGQIGAMSNIFLYIALVFVFIGILGVISHRRKFLYEEVFKHQDLHS
jgi:cytochrome c-type biogenesis protein CcsB